MESTLSLTLTDLLQDIGFFLGYGRGTGTIFDPVWTHQQETNIGVCMKSGLRQFYFPKPLEGEAASYDWSFLRPVASLPFIQSAQTVPLPDDFGGLDGQITIAATTTALMPWPLTVVGEGMLRQYYAVSPSRTGRPLAVALSPIKSAGPQRWQLNVYPAADQDYTLQVAYYLNPDSLTQGAPYPLGGLQHAETIREACLAAAETFMDDASTVHRMMFQERLAASVNSDRKTKPQTLGYNRDRSDLAAVNLGRDGTHWLGYGGITFNGTQY